MKKLNFLTNPLSKSRQSWLFFAKSLQALAIICCFTNVSRAQVPDIDADYYETVTKYHLNWEDNIIDDNRYGTNIGSDAQSPYGDYAMGKMMCTDNSGDIVSINPGYASDGTYFIYINKYRPSVSPTVGPGGGTGIVEGVDVAVKAEVTPPVIFQSYYVHSSLTRARPNIVKTDHSNNIYVAGSSYEGKGFLTKFDPDGNMVWEKIFNDDDFYDIAIYNGNGTTANARIYAVGSDHVVKYKLDGTVVWSKSNALGDNGSIFSVTVDEVSSSATVPAFGGHAVYITGCYYGIHSSSIAKVARISLTDGNIVWMDRFTGNMTESINVGRKVVTDNAGNIYVLADLSFSYGADCTTRKYAFSQSSSEGVEATCDWVQAYDQNGYGGPGGNAVDILVANDNITATGTCVYVLTNTVYVGKYHSNASITLLKYKASDGSLLWRNMTQALGSPVKGIQLQLMPDGRLATLAGESQRYDKVTYENFFETVLIQLYGTNGARSTESPDTYVCPGFKRTVGMGLCIDANNYIYVNGFSTNMAPNAAVGQSIEKTSARTNLSFVKTTDRVYHEGGPLGISKKDHSNNIEAATELAATTGINANTSVGLSASIKILPNPNTGNAMLYFEFPGEKEVKVYALNGKLVKEFSTTESSAPLNLENIPKGIYSIQVISANQNFYQRMILE